LAGQVGGAFPIKIRNFRADLSRRGVTPRPWLEPLPMIDQATSSKLIDALIAAGHKGLTKSALEKKVPAAYRSRSAAIIGELKSAGLIRGPFKAGRSQTYFAPDFAPTSTQAETLIEEFLRNTGAKLATRSELSYSVKGFLQVFLRDALAALKSEAKIVELRRGRSTFYVHREPLLDQLGIPDDQIGFEPVAPDSTPVQATVTLADVRPLYQRLKVEQGGISAVKIYDIMCGLSVAKEDLHRLLLEEERNGRVSLHRASTARFPPKVMEAGIRLAGQPEPLVTIVLKE
jgi:hypothetical protein